MVIPLHRKGLERVRSALCARVPGGAEQKTREEEAQHRIVQMAERRKHRAGNGEQNLDDSSFSEQTSKSTLGAKCLSSL